MLGVQQFDHTRFSLTAFSGLYLFGTNLEFSLAKKLLAADPGFFLGGGAALRNDFNLTSYFVCLFVCLFSQNTAYFREPQVISRGVEVGCAPPTPLP